MPNGPQINLSLGIHFLNFIALFFLSIIGKESVIFFFCKYLMKSNGDISLFIGKYKLAVSIFLLLRKISFKQK